MSDDKKNGHLNGAACPLHTNGFWDEHQDKFLKVLTQSDDMYTMLQALVDNSKHWEHLKDLSEIKGSLLSFAVGRDQIPTKTVDSLLEQLNKNFRNSVYLSGTVIIGLLIVIVFLLTGEHLGWFNLATRS